MAEEEVRSDLRSVVLITTAAAALPSAILLLVLEPLLGLWISREFAVENLPVARGLTLAFGVLSMNVPAYFLLFGLGRVRISTVVSAFAGVVFVASCLILPTSVPSFVLTKGIFALFTLSMVVYLLLLVRARRR